MNPPVLPKIMESNSHRSIFQEILKLQYENNSKCIARRSHRNIWLLQSYPLWTLWWYFFQRGRCHFIKIIMLFFSIFVILWASMPFVFKSYQHSSKPTNKTIIPWDVKIFVPLIKSLHTFLKTWEFRPFNKNSEPPFSWKKKVLYDYEKQLTTGTWQNMLIDLFRSSQISLWTQAKWHRARMSVYKTKLPFLVTGRNLKNVMYYCNRLPFKIISAFWNQPAAMSFPMFILIRFVRRTDPSRDRNMSFFLIRKICRLSLKHYAIEYCMCAWTLLKHFWRRMCADEASFTLKQIILMDI